MSSLSSSASWAASGPSSRGVAKVITAHKQREGGGFIVRRPLGGPELSYLSPFLMLDHMGPVAYGPGEAVGAPDHPHMERVACRSLHGHRYILEGGFHHQDSAGNSGDLKAGWCQWMTAGRGVVHSEMPTDELLRDGGRMEGFQLWVNLPKAHKMIPPRYQDTPPERTPWAHSEDGKVSVKVLAGESLGVSSPIETHTPIVLLDVRLQPGARFTQAVPEGYNAMAYVYSGSGCVGKDATPVQEGQAAVLTTDNGASAVDFQTTGSELRVLFLAGQPINEPVARYGPFVINTQEEIRQAFKDYEAGVLGQIAGSEERYAKTRDAVKQQQSSGKWQRDGGDV